jgi:hypothetical protein
MSIPYVEGQKAELTADGFFEHPESAEVDECLFGAGIVGESQGTGNLVRGNDIFAQDNCTSQTGS